MPNTANLGAMAGSFAARPAGAPTLDLIKPNTQSVAVTGNWTIEVTGWFPDPNPSDYRLVLHTPDGQELEEASITNLTETSLTAGYSAGPPAGSQPGAGWAEFRLESQQIPHAEYGRAPFTWTP